MLDYLMVLMLIAIVIGAILMVRNQCVYRSRLYIAYMHSDLYSKLPTYDAMIVNPAHWKLWTGKQWEAWLLKEESNA